MSSLDPENPLELVTVRGIEVAVASVALGRYTVEVKGADLDLAPIVMVVAQTPAAGSIECHTRSLTTVGGYTATVQCTDDGIATDTSFQFVVVGDVATD